MSDEPTTDSAAGSPTPDPAAVLRRDLEAQLPNDPQGVERAFGNAVRAAWVRGEPWAVEWVDRAAFGRTDGSWERE